MNQSNDYKIALYAPNLMNICIDENVNGIVMGRIYHCYTETPWNFNNLINCIELADSFFDSINFPQSSTEARSFVKGKYEDRPEMEKVRTQRQVAEFRGEIASFLVHVQYRQNSSWQGEVEWVEKNIKKSFDSELDLIKLISGAIE